MLSVNNLTKSFAGLRAVSNMALNIEANESLGLIGPNGSGKTTLINMITGIIRPNSGSILFKNEEIIGCDPYQICRKGIGRTYQLVNIFPGMTVLENVVVGRLFGGGRISFKEAEEEAHALLDFVELNGFASRQAADLTYINQKRLELARALASKPQLLLLDEFFAGLTPSELTKAINIVEKVRGMGISLIVVEHIMSVIVAVCDNVVAISAGEKICEGNPFDVLNDNTLLTSYLGDANVKC